MDLITNSPGLQHLAEEIFKHLNNNDLDKCAQVNDSWKRTLTWSLLSFCIVNDYLMDNKSAWKQITFQIMRNADQKNLEKMINVLKRILDHNKHGKCVRYCCYFCFRIGIMRVALFDLILDHFLL